MRVLHVLKTYFPDTYGGIEQVVHTIASHTTPLGIENRVLVLTPGQPRTDVAPAGYEIKRYKRDLYVASTGFSVSFLTHFKQEAAWADVMHMHFPWPFADLSYLYAGVKKPSLLSYHSDVVNQVQLNKLYAPLRDRYLAKMQTIVAASPGIMQSSPVLQKFKDKTQLITYGIEHFDQLPELDPEVKSWRQQFGERFFLFLGALRYYKGLQVTNEQKRSIMRAAYGFVFPSHIASEAFGIVLAEAAQQGTPMITCEIGTGTSYVNKQGETGLVVPPSDAIAFGQAMDAFWHDPQQVATWRAGALQRYRDTFMAETMAQKYVGVYKALL